jgi:hypothetical protein
VGSIIGMMEGLCRGDGKVEMYRQIKGYKLCAITIRVVAVHTSEILAVNDMSCFPTLSTGRMDNCTFIASWLFPYSLAFPLRERE